MEIAFRHFASLKDTTMLERRKGQDLLILHESTPGKTGMIFDQQISSELESRGHSLPAAVMASLKKRNVHPASLKGMRDRNPKIVVDDLYRYPARRDFEFWKALSKRHPRAIAYVESWLPGYSKDGRRAVLRFGFGPNPHGATATYLLIQHNGRWKVRWFNLAYYA
jgi:hypothetical protein